MVIVKKEQEKLLLEKEKNSYQPYSIEYRDFEDVFWYNGFCANNKPKWSEWKLFNDYKEIDKMKKVYDNLEDNRSRLTFTREYRMIKK